MVAGRTVLAETTSPVAYPGHVPIYDFECRACGERFEALVSASQKPACPVCATPEPKRLFSPIAGQLKTGVRGAAARRSDATRHARDERLREGFAQKRERRKHGGDG
jgi:putative FmdB family regulatory protein